MPKESVHFREISTLVYKFQNISFSIDILHKTYDMIQISFPEPTCLPTTVFKLLF